MRKLILVVGLVLAVSAPAWAYTITAGPVYDMPENLLQAPNRPAIDAGRIMVAGYPAAPNAGRSALYTIATNSLQEFGSNSFPNWAVNPNGYGQNNTIGVAGHWAGVGAGPTGNAQASKVWFADLSTNPATMIGYGPTSVDTGDEHYPDVNSYGDGIWVRWNVSSVSFDIMKADLNNPATAPVSLALLGGGGDSACANLADNARRLVYSTPTQHRIIDLGTGVDTAVYTKSTESNILRARISDDGNWIVANIRPNSEGSKRAHIVLTNVTNPAAPVSYNLTGANMNANSADVIREDPNIEIIDADTAVIVWGQCTAPEGSNIYDIRAAVVTGLAPGGLPPTMGTPVVIASSDKNLHFPDMDGDIVTWVKDWNWLGGGNVASQVVQYTWIPEPASFGLLVLGGLALLRRR